MKNEGKPMKNQGKPMENQGKHRKTKENNWKPCFWASQRVLALASQNVLPLASSLWISYFLGKTRKNIFWGLPKGAPLRPQTPKGKISQKQKLKNDNLEPSYRFFFFGQPKPKKRKLVQVFVFFGGGRPNKKKR